MGLESCLRKYVFPSLHSSTVNQISRLVEVFHPLVYSVDGLACKETKAFKQWVTSLLAAKWDRPYSKVMSFVQTRMNAVWSNTLLLRGAPYILATYLSLLACWMLTKQSLWYHLQSICPINLSLSASKGGACTIVGEDDKYVIQRSHYLMHCFVGACCKHQYHRQRDKIFGVHCHPHAPFLLLHHFRCPHFNLPNPNQRSLAHGKEVQNWSIILT